MVKQRRGEQTEFSILLNCNLKEKLHQFLYSAAKFQEMRSVLTTYSEVE